MLKDSVITTNALLFYLLVNRQNVVMNRDKRNIFILFGSSLDSELKWNPKRAASQVELEHLGRDQLELRPQHNGRIYVRSHFSLSPVVH